MPTASTGQIGFGSTISINAVPVANVISINHSGGKTGDVDITVNSSPNKYREFAKGLIDGGEVSVKMFYATACAAAVQTAIEAVKSAIVITYPDTGVLSFQGFVTGFDLPSFSDIEGALEMTLTIAVAGVATFSST